LQPCCLPGISNVAWSHDAFVSPGAESPGGAAIPASNDSAIDFTASAE
jgi:hypothetical protein